MFRFVENPQHLLAFNLVEGPRLRFRDPVGSRRLRALTMPPIMGGPGSAHRGARRLSLNEPQVAARQ